MIACTGWTWEYIAENVDLPRLESLSRYWAKCPPVHLLVAGCLGFKPSGPANQPPVDPLEQDFIPATRMSESEFSALLKSKGIPNE